MNNRDYHAKLTIYGLNKKVSVEETINWLKNEIDFLENNKEEIDETKYIGRLMK